MALTTRAVKSKRKTPAQKNEELMSQMLVLMGKIMDQAVEHSKMQQEWLKLFKPPEQQVKSTTFEEREALKNNENMWTDVDAEQLRQSLFSELTANDVGGDDLM